MAKWVRHFFRGTRADGTHFVMSGPAYRGLALVRIEKGLWSLTHMRTGGRITKVEGEYAEVRKFAETVAELTDWDEITTSEQAAAVPGLVERLKAVMSFFSDEDAVEMGGQANG